MADFEGGDEGASQGGAEAARRRRRRSRRGRTKGEPSLETVLADTARAAQTRGPSAGAEVAPGGARPGKKKRPPHDQPPSRHPGGSLKRQNGRTRRVRPPGRESEDLSPRRADAGYARAAENWWADRWLSVLYRFGWKGRLANGRMYADEGRVSRFQVERGRVKAAVQGTRTQPYDVTIQIRPLPDSDWELIVDILSCQALFTAQLLAGEMPRDIEEVFEAAYAPLFPRTKEDIKAHCTCPDWANPCKHIAAAYYVLADTFDKDPFLLFHLRGRSREELIGLLRAARAAEAQAGTMTVETLDAGSLEPFRFWQAGEELNGVAIHIGQPPFPGATAKRLGRPPFWRSPADPITRLSEVYEAIAQRAREVALNDVIVLERGR
ncbi:MAG: SWIM zinc finger family protein [Candidatus Sericytochromatia bacterium]|nr:SWIM zinc finger family protein [Candidatus Sericytochromatia bacterium]